MPDRQRSWDYLLNVLSRRAYTVAELRTKLARRQVDSELADELIARLIELRLVDDAIYAEQYVDARKVSRGRSALRSELRRKGVADEIVDSRVAGLGDQQQLSAAIGLLRKQAWRYRPKEGDHEYDHGHETLQRVRKAEARAKSFLARRGFSPDVVIAAVEQVGWFDS